MAETDPGLDDAMAALWARARPRVDARIDGIESAAAALAAGTLGDEERDAARTQAHQLAGLLGTLGLPDASPVARRLEHLLAGGPSAADAETLVAGAAELRRAAAAGPTG
ncbi:Hpt domain-containing protein [Patulibacter minatonensis]|uniref:Hpt domain-containing protein n=1 Tax=Patulibacter minatonensis TaxID=298163 RepID=UPI00047A5D0F|nr:Hpt domain-containing protein [Patulibacter minatonensis]